MLSITLKFSAPTAVMGLTNNLQMLKKWKKHMAECFTYKGKKVIMPVKDKNTIKFKNHGQQHE